jgi:hypothetical protein
MPFNLDRWVEAWRYHCQAASDNPEHRAAGESMIAQMAPDALYDEVMLHVSWRGHDEIRGMYETALGWSRGHYHTALSAFAADGSYCIEWKLQGEGNAENGLIPPHENPWEVRGISMGRYGEDGLVQYHADYWDILHWMEQGGYVPPGRDSWFANVDQAFNR